MFKLQGIRAKAHTISEIRPVRKEWPSPLGSKFAHMKHKMHCPMRSESTFWCTSVLEKINRSHPRILSISRTSRLAIDGSKKQTKNNYSTAKVSSKGFNKDGCNLGLIPKYNSNVSSNALVWLVCLATISFNWDMSVPNKDTAAKKRNTMYTWTIPDDMVITIHQTKLKPTLSPSVVAEISPDNPANIENWQI